MPTFKHPCPYCDKLIDRAVAACPYCGVAEPFSPKRCQICRKIVEDPAWVVCPSCGASLTVIVTQPGAAGTAAGAATAPLSTPAPMPAPAPLPTPTPVAATASGGKCSGCGTPLPTGARFCTVCGTTAG